MHSLTITDGWVFLPSFRKEKHQGVVGSSCVLIGRSPRHTLSPIGHVLAPPRLCTLAEMLRLLSSHQSVQFILHEQTGSKVGLSLCKSSGELWVSFWEVLTAGLWHVEYGRVEEHSGWIYRCSLVPHSSFCHLGSTTNSFCIATRDHMHFV